MYLNKDGLSTVVATVLILLLTVASVAVLANFVIPFVKNNLQKSTECLDVQNKYSFEEREGANCITEIGDLIVAIRADGAEAENNVDGFNLILKGDGFSKAVQIREGVQIQGLKMFDNSVIARIPKAGEFYSYIYSDSNSYTSAEIKTVMESGKICEKVSDKIEFGVC